MHPKEKLRSIKHFTAYHLAIDLCAGKSLSEALIFASTNPQYDDRLFVELRVQYTNIASSQHAQNMLCT